MMITNMSDVQIKLNNFLKAEGTAYVVRHLDVIEKFIRSVSEENPNYSCEAKYFLVLASACLFGFINLNMLMIESDFILCEGLPRVFLKRFLQSLTTESSGWHDVWCNDPNDVPV